MNTTIYFSSMWLDTEEAEILKHHAFYCVKWNIIKSIVFKEMFKCVHIAMQIYLQYI